MVSSRFQQPIFCSRLLVLHNNLLKQFEKHSRSLTSQSKKMKKFEVSFRVLVTHLVSMFQFISIFPSILQHLQMGASAPNRVTISVQCSVSYRNQPFILLCKTNGKFLYETQHWVSDTAVIKLMMYSVLSFEVLYIMLTNTSL